LSRFWVKMADKRLLEPRRPFPFPFKPYDIQQSLMSHIYTALRQKQVGIFESPTGTVRHRLVNL
jgi:Rad3-related DNA helicase